MGVILPLRRHLLLIGDISFHAGEGEYGGEYCCPLEGRGTGMMLTFYADRTAPHKELSSPHVSSAEPENPLLSTPAFLLWRRWQ